MNHEKVTISDIAKAAGVSITTVSRYINGKQDLIQKDTRERIEAVIKMTNYHPNVMAQSLKTNLSHHIGVIVSDISTPFYATLIQGISETLLSSDYMPLFVSCNNSIKEEESYIRSLMSRHVDGLIVNTCSSQNPLLIQQACNGLPIVLCDRTIDDYNFQFVGSNHRDPIFELVKHLKEQGYTLPVFFTENYFASSVRSERRNSFLDAVKLYYPEVDPNELTYVIDTHDTQNVISQLHHLKDICGKKELPAIFCVNSITVLHVFNAIRSLGIHIPDEIGLCGPDDWGWEEQSILLSLMTPRITSIVVQPRLIGNLAAQKLLECIADPSVTKKETRLTCPLQIAGSTILKH